VTTVGTCAFAIYCGSFRTVLDKNTHALAFGVDVNRSALK
jgi:hypothetical protein